MKKSLLPETGTFYKANLHSHSTCSDGTMTPEEMKQAYMAKGYSIIAYTDHGKLITHNELTDARFLALNGLEIGLGEFKKDDPRYNIRRNCDIGLIAPRDNVTEKPALHISPARYAPEVVLDIIQTYRDAGFFVIYNHPTWSMERYSDYMQYRGMHAMEMVNYGCVVSGFPEHNDRIYDDLLLGGRRIFCIAADDNHNKPGKPDSFGAFTVIKAQSLTYTAVTDALFAGHFYASEGPEIRELYVEDGTLNVRTSPAKRINIITPTKVCRSVSAGDGGNVCEASLHLDPVYRYVRVTVTDEWGRHAYSNAYFMDEVSE